MPELNGPLSPAQIIAQLRKQAAAVAEDAGTTNVTNFQNTGNGTSKWQWISVVGIGTFLLAGIVPWMMWMIGKMVNEVLPANTAAMTSIKEQSEDVEESLDTAHDDSVKTRTVMRALSAKIDAIVPADEEAEGP